MATLSEVLAGLGQSATSLKTQMQKLVTKVNSKADAQTMTTELGKKLDATKVGQANGVASLGEDGKVPSGQLPSQTMALIYAAL